MQEYGIISFLPHSLQELLIDRSIFDILCDAWFTPTWRLLFETFIHHLIVFPDPEKPLLTLKNIPKKFKKKITRRGLILWLPSSITKKLVPNLTYNQTIDKFIFYVNKNQDQVQVSSKFISQNKCIIGQNADSWDRLVDYKLLREKNKLIPKTDHINKEVSHISCINDTNHLGISFEKNYWDKSYVNNSLHFNFSFNEPYISSSGPVNRSISSYLYFNIDLLRKRKIKFMLTMFICLGLILMKKNRKIMKVYFQIIISYGSRFF